MDVSEILRRVVYELEFTVSLLNQLQKSGYVGSWSTSDNIEKQLSRLRTLRERTELQPEDTVTSVAPAAVVSDKGE